MEPLEDVTRKIQLVISYFPKTERKVARKSEARENAFLDFDLVDLHIFHFSFGSLLVRV
jgi:hypothetical protein